MKRRILTGLCLAVSICLISPAFSNAANNILFILDASGSMWGRVDGVPKIKTAREALNKLLADIPPDTHAGLLSYGLFSKDSCDDVHYVVSVGANNQKAISDFISKINPKGKTPIEGALKMAGDHLQYIKGAKTIVLISDGIESCGGNPCEAAGELIKKGMDFKIHVVGFDVKAKAREQLECIARAGGGSYFNADSTSGFKEAITAVKQVVAAAEPKPQPKLYFQDDFNGAELGDQWEVLNPNPDGFIVEDGQLLIINSSMGAFAEENIENLFRLKKTIPKGDWMMTARVKIDFQTSQEKFVLGLYKDKKNYIMAGAWLPFVWGQRCQLNLDAVKAGGGKIASFQKIVYDDEKAHPNYADITKVFLPLQPILLRLKKQGRKFVASLKLEGLEKSQWKELESLTSLRADGELVLGLFQTKKTQGETNVKVDWVKVETLE
ncbi:MAG: VWA domain-containing protein [Pseudomonadota bacterium]